MKSKEEEIIELRREAARDILEYTSARMSVCIAQELIDGPADILRAMSLIKEVLRHVL